MSLFCDQTVVEFIGGKGGDGSVSFRREKYVARGGPNGGDGGNGGCIVLVADENINTLLDLNTQKIYRAQEGGNGQKQNMHGKNGEDLVIKVPAGTLVYENSPRQLLFDLKTHGQSFVVARGGKGGLGNTHFKSSIHQAPDFAESGEEGQKIIVFLELQLVADVGIIGFPSAGKSTLISRISNAKPKIADYPFTTLIPNLGVVDMSRFNKKIKDSFVVADIPGLIEGAHAGKGLGHEFLRHVSRTELLIHLVDPTRENPEDYLVINAELEKFDRRLSGKEQITAVSKCDLFSGEAIDEYVKKLVKIAKIPKSKVYKISSATGVGLKELMLEVHKRINLFRQKREQNLAGKEIEIEQIEKVYRPHLEKKKFTVFFRRSKLEAETGKERRIFDVTGDRIEQVVKMTDLENPEGLERIHHYLNKMGIKNELKKQGARPGDRIRIAGKTILMR